MSPCSKVLASVAFAEGADSTAGSGSVTAGSWAGQLRARTKSDARDLASSDLASSCPDRGREHERAVDCFWAI
jgi:hypothetical protein